MVGNTETPTIEDAAVNEPETVVPTDEPETAETVPAETEPATAEEELLKLLTEEIENPQLYSTNYITDDYTISLIHEITLGDFLISMLLCVLIVIKIVSATLGGGRRW